eukprot:scaffold4756_cov116-Isochrysis_galbana.AAC.2
MAKAKSARKTTLHKLYIRSTYRHMGLLSAIGRVRRGRCAREARGRCACACAQYQYSTSSPPSCTNT